MNLGKCKGENMVPWLNKKFKDKKEKLLLNGRDAFYHWKTFNYWGSGFNSGGGMNTKRFKFKDAYITRIKINNVYVRDQGWGNRTNLYIGVTSPTKNKKFIYISKKARNTYRFDIDETFDLKNEVKKGNVVNEIFFRPSRLGAGHKMEYGGVANIKVWGYEV